MFGMLFKTGYVTGKVFFSKSKFNSRFNPTSRGFANRGCFERLGKTEKSPKIAPFVARETRESTTRIPISQNRSVRGTRVGKLDAEKLCVYHPGPCHDASTPVAHPRGRCTQYNPPCSFEV